MKRKREGEKKPNSKLSPKPLYVLPHCAANLAKVARARDHSLSSAPRALSPQSFNGIYTEAIPIYRAKRLTRALVMLILTFADI